MSRDAKQQKERRRRERAYREKRASHDYLKPKPAIEPIRRIGILSYDVSFDPIPDTTPASLRFEKAVPYEESEKVFHQAQHEPKLAIPQLEKWSQDFPDVPRIQNWLAMAYSFAGDEAKSEEASRKLYEQHPNYLFAIVSESHRRIKAGDLDWVARRLHRKWEVKLLYPYRDVFHFTEVRAFHHMLVHYFVAAKDIPQAEISLRAIEQLLDEDDPAILDARWQIVRARMGSGVLSRMASVLRSGIRSVSKAAALPEDSQEEEDEMLPGILRD